MPDYPFITPPTGGSREFKILKEDLKQKGYPLKGTRQLVDQHYQEVFKPLHSTLSNSILVKVPSGSGENKIVDLLANQIALNTNSEILNPEAFTKLHTGQAKANLDPSKRADNPIHYQPNAKFDFKPYEGKKAFIVDDVLSTGESTVRLAQAMEAVGMKVEGIAALVTVEQRKPSNRDFQRVGDKLSMVTKDSKNTLQQDLKTAFGPYNRQRLNRFERGLTTSKTLEKGLSTVKKLVKAEKLIENKLKEFKITMQPGRGRAH